MSGPSPIDTAADDRATALKERIYVTFSQLGVLLALHADADHGSVRESAIVIVVSLLGTVLAVTMADVLAAIVVHHAPPDRAEVAHLARVGAGALSVAILPLLLLGATAIGLLSLSVELAVGAGVLAVTLVLIGALAVRRLDLSLPQRVFAFAIEALLAAAIIALELLVH